MTLNENDLIYVVDELRLKGYNDSFIIKDNLVFSESLDRGFKEDEVVIEAAYRFDVTEDAYDTQNIFAVFIPKCQIRGLIIDLLAMYSYMEEQSITRILRDAELVSYIFDDKDPYVKFGLKKVTPADFDKDSSRYVLRVGFPDFPACPAGTAFTMVGFDQQEKEYIWLATSILKDNRLRHIAYDGSGS